MYTFRRATPLAAAAIVAASALPAFCADPPAVPPSNTPTPATSSQEKAPAATAPQQASPRSDLLTQADLARLEAEGRLVRKSELAAYAKKADVDALIAQMQDLLARLRALRAQLDGTEPATAAKEAPSAPRRH
jgi:hypothetical protein